jgi:hypothetical protein
MKAGLTPEVVIRQDRPMFTLPDGKVVDATTRCELAIESLGQQYKANLARATLVSHEQDSVQRDVDRLSSHAKALIDPAAANAARVSR